MSYRWNEKYKYYEVSFYVKEADGKNKQIHKRGFATVKAAKEYEFEVKSKYNNSSEMTFLSMYELYSEYNDRRIKESSKATKKTIFNTHILPYFKNMKLNKITPLIISRWQNEMLEKGLSSLYLNDCNAQLKAVFTHSYKFFDIKNPMKKLEPICSKGQKEKNVWGLEEFNIFYSSLNKEIHKTLFYTLFYTGMRIGEALALTYDDIDLEKCYIYINKTINRFQKITTPKTKSSIRKIKITKEHSEILKKYLNRLYNLEKNDRIFMLIVQSVNNILRFRCEKLGLPAISAHGLRHSHTSLLMSSGANPVAVSKRLGHSNITITLNRYSHLLNDDENNLLKKLEK